MSPLDETFGAPCGCLPPPPSFEMLPPPMPPPSFVEFNSIAENIDWAAALNSDPLLETCRNEIDQWLSSVEVCRWSGSDVDQSGSNKELDDFVDVLERNRFDILDQSLIAVIGATSILLVSICLAAFYFWRKSTRRSCLQFVPRTKRLAYQNRNGYSPASSNPGRRRNIGEATRFRIIEAASPATTTTTVIAPQSLHRLGYNLSNAGDSAEEMSEGENDFFLGRGTSAATDWSYNAMTPKNGIKSKGVHTRINGHFNGASKYGAIPTSTTYERTAKAQPLPFMVISGDNGHVITRTSKSILSPIDQSILYDNHNPIYEEISLHEKSIDQFPYQRQKSKEFAEVAIGYVDSGASSANSDEANLPMVDEEFDEENHNAGPCCPNRYGSISIANGPTSLVHSPCCSSGRSECEECCPEESLRCHGKNECPFSPRPRSRHLEFVPTASETPSPIRSKTSKKINRSTQSGQSCLGNEDFYSNACYECSGRESGYGTEGRRRSPAQNRLKHPNKAIVGGNMRTMDATGKHPQLRPSPVFYTLKNGNINQSINRSPVNQLIRNERRSDNSNRTHSTAILYENVHKSDFV